MKCWMRYVLPWIMAFSLFLGSSFFSLDVNAQEKGTEGLGYESYFLACREDVQEVLDGRGYSLDDFYYYGYFDESSGFVRVYVTNQKFVCDSCTDSSFTFTTQYITIFTFDISTGSDCKIMSSNYRYQSTRANFTYKIDSTAFSNYNIYYRGTDEIFFQGPSPFQRVVRTQDWAAVMTEIIIILPLLILSLTSLLALRKGLKHILSFLRQA